MTLPRLGMGMGTLEGAFFRHLDQAIENRSWLGGRFTYVEIGIADAGTFRPVSGYLGDRVSDLRAIGLDPFTDAPEATPIASQEFLRLCWPGGEIDFLLVDGCHGKPCVMGDFLAAEPLVARGGIVCFHDTGENVQGCLGPVGMQHCGTGIATRAALEELGLLGEWRPGWKLLQELDADPSNDCYGCMFFKKE